MKLIKYKNGAKWRLILYQDYGSAGCFKTNEVTNCDRPGLYSKLSEMDNYRLKTLPYYSFLLEYPEKNLHNIWMQASSPNSLGYTSTQAITCTDCQSKSNFGALRTFSNGCTLYSADARTGGAFWYSIGVSYYDGGIPGPDAVLVNIVALYIQTDYSRCSPHIRNINNLRPSFVILVLIS